MWCRPLAGANKCPTRHGRGLRVSNGEHTVERTEAQTSSRTSIKRVAIYARVSTFDQSCEPQLRDLREYVAARGWRAAEYIDQGVSGARDRRPALDKLLA